MSRSNYETLRQNFLEFDGETFNQNMTITLNKLQQQSEQATEAAAVALKMFAEYLLALMQHNIPHSKSGENRLAKSGSVTNPIVTGGLCSVMIQWTAPYARIQDTGGFVTPKPFRAVTTQDPNTYRQQNNKGTGFTYITRHQVNAARLFIPLRPGVFPIKEPWLRKSFGWKCGTDFILSRYAVIKGSRYITNVMNGEAKNADKTIKQLFLALLNSMTGTPQKFRESNAGPMDMRPAKDMPVVDTSNTILSGGNDE